MTYQWTVERYHQAIDSGIFDDESVELLTGNLVIMPPEREPHAYYNTETADYLRALLGKQAKIRDAKPITLSNYSEPEPDLAIVKPLGRIYLTRHPYPEDIFWLIEISQATLDKDRGYKKNIYAEAGIQEYWLINLQDLQLNIFRNLVNGQYTEELSLQTGTISPLAFPSIKIEVERILHP